MECSTQDKEINNCKALCRCTGSQALSLFSTDQSKEREGISNCQLSFGHRSNIRTISEREKYLYVVYYHSLGTFWWNL